jgi:hypothetical protein
MKYIQIITLVSQILEVIGAYLLFKFSLPPHINKLSGVFAPDIDNQPDYTKELADNKKYEKCTKYGFLLVFIGFLLNFLVYIYNFINCD